MLGLIDAALGRKDEALREGRRAAELLPITKDALNGSGIVLYFAMISAWVGEKDLACEQLAKARNHSREVSYVQSNPLYCSLSAMSLVALLATETLPAFADGGAVDTMNLCKFWSSKMKLRPKNP